MINPFKKPQNLQSKQTKLTTLNSIDKKLVNPLIVTNVEKSKINNLKNILNQTFKNGERLILLNKLSERLLTVAPEEAIKYASQALMLGKVINAKQHLMKSNLILGTYYCVMKDFENALMHYNSLLLLSLEIKDKVASSNAYVQVGHANLQLGRVKCSINSYKQALKLYQELSNEPVSYKLLLILGELNKEAANWKDAEFYFQKALIKQRKLRSDLAEEAELLGKLGNIFLHTNQFEKAETVLVEAIEINQELENKAQVAENSNDLGLVCLKLKRYDQAIHCFTNSLKINDLISDTIGVATSYKNLGTVNYELERYDESIRNYNQALDAFKVLGINLEVLELLETLGKLYYLLKKYRKAISYFTQATKIEMIPQNHTSAINCQFYLGKIYLKTKDPKKAIFHFENCSALVEEANLQSEFIEVYQEIANCYAQLNMFNEAFQMQKKYNILFGFKFSNNDHARVAQLEYKENDNLKKIKHLHNQNIELRRLVLSTIQEMREPVRAISSFTDLLMDGDIHPKANKEEFLQIISRSSKRINSFLKDVDTYTRIIDKSNFPTSDFSLETILWNVIENLGINKRILPNIDVILSELPKVSADRDEMTLVIESILLNALKHNAGKEMMIWIKAQDKDDHYVISIEDNGAIVNQSAQNHIINQFAEVGVPENYSSTKTDFGLTMAKKVLNNRNHDIWIETPSSSIGTRVLFTVSKPSL